MKTFRKKGAILLTLMLVFSIISVQMAFVDLAFASTSDILSQNFDDVSAGTKLTTTKSSQNWAIPTGEKSATDTAATWYKGYGVNTGGTSTSYAASLTMGSGAATITGAKFDINTNDKLYVTTTKANMSSNGLTGIVIAEAKIKAPSTGSVYFGTTNATNNRMLGVRTYLGPTTISAVSGNGSSTTTTTSPTTITAGTSYYVRLVMNIPTTGTATYYVYYGTSLNDMTNLVKTDSVGPFNFEERENIGTSSFKYLFFSASATDVSTEIDDVRIYSGSYGTSTILDNMTGGSKTTNSTSAGVVANGYYQETGNFLMSNTSGYFMNGIDSRYQVDTSSNASVKFIPNLQSQAGFYKVSIPVIQKSSQYTFKVDVSHNGVTDTTTVSYPGSNKANYWQEVGIFYFGGTGYNDSTPTSSTEYIKLHTPSAANVFRGDGAKFELLSTVECHYITTSVVGGNGSATVNNSTVTRGQNAVFTITPTTGYEIATATYNNSDVKSAIVSNQYTALNVEADGTFNVTFKKMKYGVSYNTPTNGTVSASGLTDGQAEHGNTVTFTVTPTNEDYEIATLTYNGASVTANSNGQYSTTVTATGTLNATFRLKTLVAPTADATTLAVSNEVTKDVTNSNGQTQSYKFPRSVVHKATLPINPGNSSNYNTSNFEYGMILTDTKNTPATDDDKKIYIKVSRDKKQYAVQVYGDGLIVGREYTLTSYVKYTNEGNTQELLGTPKTFTWTAE